MPSYGANGYGYGGEYAYGGEDYQLAVTVQTGVYPPRVLVSTSGLGVGQVVTISRQPAGSTVRTVVRGAHNVSLTGDAFIRVDAEAPFGVPLTYTLTVDGADTAETTVILTGLTKVALSDAISGAAAEAVILAWPEKRSDRAASVFAIGGRNVVVSGQAGGFSSTIDLFVETDESKNNVLSLLQTATSGIVQLRADRATTSDGVDCYISPLSINEVRYSQDGSDERRIISLDVVETTPWGPSLSSAGFTLLDISEAYPAGTLADIAADYDTLLDIALGDFS